MSFNPKIKGADLMAGRGQGALANLTLAGSSRLFFVVAYNLAAADRWLFIYDRTTVPADTTIPDLPPVRIPAKSNGSVDYGTSGRPMGSGVTVVVSTTEATLTQTGGNDCFLDIGVRQGS